MFKRRIPNQNPALLIIINIKQINFYRKFLFTNYPYTICMKKMIIVSFYNFPISIKFNQLLVHPSGKCSPDNSSSSIKLRNWPPPGVSPVYSTLSGELLLTRI